MKTTVLLSLISVSLFLVQCGGSEEQLVYTDSVEVRDIVETISASGKIQPEMEVKISSDVSGEIVELFVMEGDSVKEGQLLMEINPEIYASENDRMQAMVSQAQSGLASARSRQSQAEAQFEQSELAFERSSKLYQKEAISAAEYEQSKSAYLVAQNELKAAKQAVDGAAYNVRSVEAGLKAARENLNRTRLLSPMDGVVSRLDVEKGERVVGTAQMTGTEMLRIANLSNMEVRVEVNENDIVKVKLGDTASIDVDAYSNRSFTGVVTSIANSPAGQNAIISSDQVTNFEVRIRILRSSYEDLLVGLNSKMSPFRPGMSASVDIRTRRANNVKSIPIGAVVARADTTQPASSLSTFKEYVFVADSGKAKMLEVETGIQDLQYIEIKSGLGNYRQVISGPYSLISKTLKSGDAIQVVDKSLLYETMIEP
jgi:HlyD family secretion protein